MMVGVQPTPAHPFPLGESTEHGMINACDVRGVEAGELFKRVSLDCGEVSASEAEETLVYLRARGEVFRPRSRKPECSPLYDCSLEQTDLFADQFFAEWDANGIREMLKHLARVHAPPAMLIAGRDGGEAGGEGVEVNFVGQSFHHKSGYGS
jgi:hypothetical protein